MSRQERVKDGKISELSYIYLKKKFSSWFPRATTKKFCKQYTFLIKLIKKIGFPPILTWLFFFVVSNWYFALKISVKKVKREWVANMNWITRIPYFKGVWHKTIYTNMIGMLHANCTIQLISGWKPIRLIDKEVTSKIVLEFLSTSSRNKIFFLEDVKKWWRLLAFSTEKKRSDQIVSSFLLSMS